MPPESPKSRQARTDDLAVVRRLLAALPEIERTAIARYYRGETVAQIETRLHLPHGRVAELRMELSKRFFAALLERHGPGHLLDGGPAPK